MLSPLRGWFTPSSSDYLLAFSNGGGMLTVDKVRTNEFQRLDNANDKAPRFSAPALCNCSDRVVDRGAFFCALARQWVLIRGHGHLAVIRVPGGRRG